MFKNYIVLGIGWKFHIDRHQIKTNLILLQLAEVISIILIIAWKEVHFQQQTHDTANTVHVELWGRKNTSCSHYSRDMNFTINKWETS